MKRIYLDNASTTPISDTIRALASKYNKDIIGNPGSLHQEGVKAKRALIEAKKKIGSVLHAQPDEIIITSGTTESNNLAIFGIINRYLNLFSNSQISVNKKIHIVSTSFEHHSVLMPLRELEKHGVEVTYIVPERNGLVDPRKIREALNDNTVLVSVMYAQNEIGTIQPIKEIAKVVRQHRNEAIKNETLASEIIFHVDAAQAPGYLNLNVLELNVDLMSFGGHKFYGPKGVGFLYKRRPVLLNSTTFGGSQEKGMRAGTENVPAALSMAEALIEAEKFKNRETKRLVELRSYFIGQLSKFVPSAIVNGDLNERLVNNINFSIPKMDGEVIVLELDARGVAVSTGSACTTDELGPSHVLLAIGVAPELALGSVRISMGRSTTKRDLQYVLKCLKEIVEKYKNVLI